MFLDRHVHLEDGASHRGVQIRDGLDGLDLAEGFPGLERATWLGQVAVVQVTLVAAAQLLDREIGDPDGHRGAVGLHPFVALRVFAIVRTHGLRHSSS